MVMSDLPYGGTSGWSGTDTSYERAVQLSTTGEISRRQRKTLQYMRERGALGVTWKDLSGYFGWHHGSASSVLTVLHKTEHIVRLMNRREKCRIYVLPEFQQGRDSDQPVQRMTQTQMCDHLVFLWHQADLTDDFMAKGYCEHLLNSYWPDWKDILG